MAYFIVDAPYEKCFDLFFQTELGYPNFYRMTELLPSSEQYHNLTLVAPYQCKEPSVINKIAEKVNGLGIPHLLFGEGLDTAFAFDSEGKLDIHPQFKQALSHAVNEFLGSQQRPCA